MEHFVRLNRDLLDSAKGPGGLQGPASPEKKIISNARTSPRPKGYVAKLENLERVRGQGCPTRFGYEGYVAKRRNGQRVER